MRKYEMEKLTRAEIRRKKREQEKDTVYHLTKSQINAIKTQAVNEVTERYSDLEQKIRAEYQRQLDDCINRNEKLLKDQRCKDLNLVLAASLHALYDTFQWKVYNNDHYQRYLTTLMGMLNSDGLDFIKEKQWVKKNLGLELKEI